MFFDPILTLLCLPDSFHISTKIKPPEDIPEHTARAAGEYYIDRVLRHLNSADTLRHEVGYDGCVKVDIVIPKDGFNAESIKQALRENATFFAHGIVLETRELYTRGISGRLKYDTVFE